MSAETVSLETANLEIAKPLGQTEHRLWHRWMLGAQLTRLEAWPPANPAPDSSVTIDRLNRSIQWHTLASHQALRWYNSLKVLQISAAAAIPVITASGADSSASR